MPRTADKREKDRIWRLLLAAVEHLHGLGFTGIRGLPYFGAVGYWRIEVTTADNLHSGVNLPERDSDAVFRATEGGFPRVGGLLVEPSTTVDDVANEILRSLGFPREVIYFNDTEYCSWFAELRRRSDEIGFPPAAFGDYFYGWRCGEVDIAPPPGWEKQW